MRDENSRKKFIATIAVFVAVIFLINAGPFKDSAPASATRSILLTVISPVTFVADKITAWPRAVITGIATLRGAQNQNYLIRDKLDLALARLLANEELEAENAKLREIIGFKHRNPFRLELVAAEVIARSPSSWFDEMVIDKGSKHGIRAGKAVITRNGLVGKVIETASNSSRVMLITDNNCPVSSMLSKTRDIGLLQGLESGTMLLKYIPSTASVEVGAVVVTSGVSETFPKGIPVGTVSKIEKRDYDLFKYIEIKSSVDLAKLSRVFVVR